MEGGIRSCDGEAASEVKMTEERACRQTGQPKEPRGTSPSRNCGSRKIWTKAPTDDSLKRRCRDHKQGFSRGRVASSCQKSFIDPLARLAILITKKSRCSQVSVHTSAALEFQACYCCSPDSDLRSNPCPSSTQRGHERIWPITYCSFYSATSSTDVAIAPNDGG